jgi:hypothetical protein
MRPARRAIQRRSGRRGVAGMRALAKSGSCSWQFAGTIAVLTCPPSIADVLARC